MEYRGAVPLQHHREPHFPGHGYGFLGGGNGGFGHHGNAVSFQDLFRFRLRQHGPAHYPIPALPIDAHPR